MYPAIIIFQCLGLVLIMFEIIYVVKLKPSSLTSIFLVFSLSLFVNTLGYLFELLSRTLDTAIMAVRFTYFGKVYISFIIFLFVIRYCKIRIPHIVLSILLVFHTAVAIMVLTSDYHRLYYSSIGFARSGLFPHLVLGHGPVYWIYGTICIIYLILMPLFCLYRYRSAVSKNDSQRLVLLIMITSIPLTGYLLFLFGVTNGYDTTAPAYIVASSLMFMGFIKTGFFDTVDLAKDNVLDNLEDGIVVLDNSNQFLYANATAKTIFPELQNDEADTDIIDYIFELLYSHENYIKNGNIYSSKLQAIFSGNQVRGKLISMNDITSSYNYTRNLESAVNAKTEQLKHMQGTVIESLANMIEARDGVTGQHVKRTSAYVKILTNALKERGCFVEELTDSEIDNIIHAAPLHDIGKIAIPDAILCKPGRLTPEEFEIIKTHPTVGAHMVEEILKEVDNDDYLNVARDVAHYHHEKWDGTGYPCGLKENEIPLSARIMAITDVFEALISERPYKKGFSFEKSMEIIEEGAGVHFDPVIANVFVSIIDDIKKVS